MLFILNSQHCNSWCPSILNSHKVLSNRVSALQDCRCCRCSVENSFLISVGFFSRIVALVAIFVFFEILDSASEGHEKGADNYTLLIVKKKQILWTHSVISLLFQKLIKLNESFVIARLKQLRTYHVHFCGMFFLCLLALLDF